MTDQIYYYGLGRRKCAVARVRVMAGNGNVTINGKEFETAFPSETLRRRIIEPLQVADAARKFNVVAKVTGGGVSGEADALRHAIARALAKKDDSLRVLMRRQGMLTQDSRIVERKKYGLKGARKAPQYTKR